MDGRPRPWLVFRRAATPDSPAPPPPDDAQLLASLRAGRSEAGSALYDRVRPQVDRSLRRLLGSRDAEREDVVQQVLLEIVSSIDSFRGECPLDAWTSRVTAHVVFKHLRRRRLERLWLIPELTEEHAVADARENVAGRAWRRQVLTRLGEHLRAIEPKRAWAFLLHDVHGYDLQELAGIQGVSVAAAQSRLSRGRRDLHHRVERDADLAAALEAWEGAP